MEKFSRAQRRADNSRLKKNRETRHPDAFNTPRRRGLLLNTATPCSCFMCGNPRKNFKAQSLKEESFAELEKSCSRDLAGLPPIKEQSLEP